jgi:hypothetical protein
MTAPPASGFDFFNGIKNGTVSPPPMAQRHRDRRG